VNATLVPWALVDSGVGEEPMSPAGECCILPIRVWPCCTILGVLSDSCASDICPRRRERERKSEARI
jgi:hypothetical protein